jgi:peptidoglycan/LPS O-acetylase OafA/YrhL
VLLTHTSYAAGIMDVGTKKGWPVFDWLTVGLTVTLAPFFLLSGMLLYRSFARATFTGKRHPALVPFFVRRGLRILPAYWVFVAIAMLTLNLKTITSPWQALRPFLLLHYFVDTQNDYYPGLEITWSVVTEVIFYLLLPIGAWLISRYARRVTDPAQQLRRIIWSLVPFPLIGLGWEIYTHMPSMGQYPIQMFWPPGFLGVLAIGMMFGAMSAYHEVTGKEPWLFRVVAKSPLSWWAAAFGVYILNCVKPLQAGPSGDWPPTSQALMDHVLFVVFGVLVMLPLIAPSARSRLMDGLLGNKVSQFLGRISFGVYLWHFPMMYFGFHMGALFGNPTQPMDAVIGTVGSWQLLGEVLIGSIILATLSHYLIERPAGRLGGRLVRQGAPTATL